jgi:hypothetical protein
METSGYKIYETTPYILYGETLLFLNYPNEAKEAFYRATKYGATKGILAISQIFILMLHAKR